jgi:uncharacterized protein YgiM (DUF1202 family)
MCCSDIPKGARDWAVSKVGCKYSQAGRTQENIFDCSSLVARAYSAMGKAWKYGGRVPLSCNEVYDDDFELLWPASYAEIGKQFGGSSVIAKANRPGDLQFLNTMKTSRANKITHVAMVASASKIVHARGTAYGVRMDSLTHYAGKVCALTRYNPACDLVVGHKGYRTAALQKALNKHGADLNGDGEFGLKTQAALKEFQKAKGLPVTGKGDAATLAALGLAHAAASPEGKQDTAPNDSIPTAPAKSIRVTANSVNIRTGPGTGFDVVKAVNKGTRLTLTDTDGWRPVLFGDEVCWISTKYTQEAPI